MCQLADQEQINIAWGFLVLCHLADQEHIIITCGLLVLCVI
jgi:hypothetical protein